MFKRFLNVCKLLMISLFIIVTVVACKKENVMNVKEVEPYLYEVDTYNELDYENAKKFYAENYDNWGGGCSCIAKNMDDGRVIFGRNMDLNISNKCAYVVRTACKGKYKTMGLAYTFREYSPDYEKVKQNGISEKFGKILPFICDDIMNEKGLYMELNMRHGEVWPAGQDKFACSGTNPSSAERVYMFAVSRYVLENCATVDEAIEYIKTLDIYSKEKYWNYCFMIGDASGEYGLIEFAANNVYWLPGQVGQTNYYINDYASEIQDQKTGLGRYEKLVSGIDSVKTKKDMFDLIDSVTYFQFYDPYNAKFDARAENIGELPGLTKDVVMAPEFKEIAYKLMDDFGKPIRSKSRQELRDANEYWESSLTEVVDCTEKSIFVRFFENNDMKYKLTFDGFVKQDII